MGVAACHMTRAGLTSVANNLMFIVDGQVPIRIHGHNDTSNVRLHVKEEKQGNKIKMFSPRAPHEHKPYVYLLVGVTLLQYCDNVVFVDFIQQDEVANGNHLRPTAERKRSRNAARQARHPRRSGALRVA